jgi:hypothetical protein
VLGLLRQGVHAFRGDRQRGRGVEGRDVRPNLRFALAMQPTVVAGVALAKSALPLAIGHRRHRVRSLNVRHDDSVVTFDRQINPGITKIIKFIMESMVLALRPIVFVMRPIESVLRPIVFVLRSIVFVLRPIVFVMRPIDCVLRPIVFVVRSIVFVLQPIDCVMRAADVLARNSRSARGGASVAC